MTLFNFEEDNLNVDDVYQWIYTTQGLQTFLSDMKEWFRFRRRENCGTLEDVEKNINPTVRQTFTW